MLEKDNLYFMVGVADFLLKLNTFDLIIVIEQRKKKNMRYNFFLDNSKNIH